MGYNVVKQLTWLIFVTLASKILSKLKSPTSTILISDVAISFMFSIKPSMKLFNDPGAQYTIIKNHFRFLFPSRQTVIQLQLATGILQLLIVVYCKTIWSRIMNIFLYVNRFINWSVSTSVIHMSLSKSHIVTE